MRSLFGKQQDNNTDYEILLTGKVGKLFDEAIRMTRENPVEVLEKMICEYHKNAFSENSNCIIDDEYKMLKVGKIANIHLRKLLESSTISEELLISLQKLDYSKVNFDLQYPLLVKEGKIFETIRYYKEPLYINGDKFYLCSQWFETSVNDDRSYLIYWMKSFKNK